MVAQTAVLAVCGLLLTAEKITNYQLRITGGAAIGSVKDEV
jgi:hypothetical protein